MRYLPYVIAVIAAVIIVVNGTNLWLLMLAILPAIILAIYRLRTEGKA